MLNGRRQTQHSQLTSLGGCRSSTDAGMLGMLRHAAVLHFLWPDPTVSQEGPASRACLLLASCIPYQTLPDLFDGRHVSWPSGVSTAEILRFYERSARRLRFWRDCSFVLLDGNNDSNDNHDDYSCCWLLLLLLVVRLLRLLPLLLLVLNGAAGAPTSKGLGCIRALPQPSPTQSFIDRLRHTDR